VLYLVAAAALAPACTFNVEAVSQSKRAVFDEPGWATLRASAEGLEGGLSVAGTTDTGVTATVHLTGLVPRGSAPNVVRDVNVVFQRSNDIVSLTLDYAGAGSELFHFDRLDLDVPKAANLELSTVGAPIEAFGLAGDVRLDAKGGFVKLVTTGTATVLSTGGRVEATVGSGTFGTTSGDILATVLGEVTAATESGRVDLRFPEPGFGPVDVTCATGAVVLLLPAGEGVSLDYQTESGGIDVAVGPTREMTDEWDGHILAVNGGGWP